MNVDSFVDCRQKSNAFDDLIYPQDTAFVDQDKNSLMRAPETGNQNEAKFDFHI